MSGFKQRQQAFRIWNTDKNLWETRWISISQLLRGLPKYTQVEDYAITEWTGLVDVNNVDIFEGDIIHDKTVDDTWTIYHDEENSGWGSAPKYGSYFLATSLGNSLEVVGNRFENPNKVTEIES